MTSCLLFEGWFAHLLPTRAAVQAVENCSLWLLAENGFWAADQICIVASRWSRWLLAFASYLYMLYSNYIYLCDMDMGMNLYEFDIYIIYICMYVYRSIYRIYIYSKCPCVLHLFLSFAWCRYRQVTPGAVLRSSTAALSLESVGSGSGDDGAEGWAMACCANTKPPGGAAMGMWWDRDGCRG